eukprot:2240687-Rhodomonas_salina.1
MSWMMRKAAAGFSFGVGKQSLRVTGGSPGSADVTIVTKDPDRRVEGVPCIFSVHAGLARNGCAGLDIRLCSSVAQTGKETTVALKTDGVGFVLSHPIPTTSSFSSFSAVHAKSRVSDSLTPTCRSFWRTFRQNDTDHLTRHVAAENGGSFRRVWRGQGEWNYACLSALSRCPELTSRLMLQGNLGRRRYGA